MMILTLILLFATFGSSSTVGIGAHFDSSTLIQLKAATKKSDILRRSSEIKLSHTVNLAYAESDNAHGDDSVFSSNVRLGSSAPVLLLEEIEHLTSGIDCTTSSISVRFSTHDAFAAAQSSFAGLDADGTIITSHPGCSNDGDRSPFKVTAISYTESQLLAAFNVTRTSWRTFSSAAFSFGSSNDQHILRRHSPLPKRTATQVPSPPTIVEILPSVTATAKTATLNLDYSTNATFQFPPGIGGSGVEIPAVDVPMTATCLDCRTRGKVTLRQTSFELEDITDIELDELKVFKSGSVELRLDGFKATVWLSTSPALAASFTHTLFSFPIPFAGFALGSIGRAGFTFSPELKLDVKIEGGVQFDFGFEVKVPDNSIIKFDFANLKNSAFKGFPDAEISLLPFHANVSDISLSVTASLRPRFPIGISLLDDAIIAEVSPYIDAPSLNTTITQLASAAVNATCDTSPADELLADAFQNLTHIKSFVGVAGGFDLKIGAQLPGRYFETELVDPATTAWPLPTKCLAFRTGGTEAGLVTATAALQSLRAEQSLAAQRSMEAAKSKPTGEVESTGTGDRSGAGSAGSLRKPCLWGLLGTSVMFLML